MPISFIHFLLALIFSVLGLLLATHHALWPLAMAVLFYFWLVLVAWRPSLWLVAVLALLPVLNFSPWNGWLIAEEFDLFILATLAGCYAAMALKPTRQESQNLNKVSTYSLNSKQKQRNNVLLLAIGALTLLACWRGLATNDLSPQWWQSGWALLQTQGYTEPLNSLRSAKGVFWALLFVPLLRYQLRQKEQEKEQEKEQDKEYEKAREKRHSAVTKAEVSTLLAYGQLAGLCVVVVAILWERAAFPGLFNFSTHYRTTALFWEMHTGGAALDVYLVLSLPFAFWAVGRARGPVRWLAAGLLLTLTCYALLTTFSRGVYAAALLPLALLGFWRVLDKTGWSQRFHGLRQVNTKPLRRRRGLWALAAVLLLEVVWVFGGGSYMRSRLDDSGDDLSLRVAHWQRGLTLLGNPAVEPFNWLLGIGLGRLPGAYANSPEASGWAGQAALATHGAGNKHLTLSGPNRDADLTGLFSINQRVGVWAPDNYRVLLQIRVKKPTRLLLKLCEKHQIYEGNCYYSHFSVQPLQEGTDAAQSWQKLSVRLQALDPLQSSNSTGRPAVLSASVLDLGGKADLAVVRLVQSNGKELTQNSDFSHGMAFWMQGAGTYYLPWHIDNLLLELLIERGLIQMLLTGLLWAKALESLRAIACWQAPSVAKSLAPFMACALVSVALLGLVSSVLDVPRLCFLIFLLILIALMWSEQVPKPIA